MKSNRPKNMDEAAGASSRDDVSKELLLLILSELQRHPELASAFDVLKTSAEHHHLLPARLGHDGSSTPSTYEQARIMYPIVCSGAGSLLERLRGLMEAAGSRSLLDSRVMTGERRKQMPLLASVLSSSRMTIHDYVLHARGLGLLPTTVEGRGLDFATIQRACPWNHFFTVRGHSLAAYCAVYDKTGDLIITGSDDRLVKIWSSRTGLLLKSCRGHLHEIADLSVSSDNKMLASASIDGVIRLWNIEGFRRSRAAGAQASTAAAAGIDVHRFGRLMGTLESHGCLISSLAFSPTCPHELLSAAFDGTCRVWDVRDGTYRVLEWDWAAEERSRGRAAPHMNLRHNLNDVSGGDRGDRMDVDGEGDGGDHVEDADSEASRSISTAVYSNDGRFIVSGVANGKICLWKRDENFANHVDLVSSPNAVPSPSVAFSPVELMQGRHGSDVYLLSISHGGDRLLSASRDGMVCVWKLKKRDRKRAPLETWKVEASFVAPEREEQHGGRRRREEAPRVDQVAWNADDSLVLASTHAFEVAVYSVARGCVVKRLSGVHTEPVHVIICHPFEPRLAMTASYSGEVVLWDLVVGSPLKVFYSVDCRPDGRKWPDPIPYVDGYWGPDGNQVTLSDASGQLHVIAVGTPDPWLERTPYDQYLSHDYDELFVDAEGVVRSVENNQPADAIDPAEVLCDATATPYPHGFQIAYRSQSLMSSPWGDVRWIEPGQQPGYVMNSPTLTAAHWRAYVTGSGNESQVTQAINRAQLRMQEHERRLDMPEDPGRGHGRGQSSRPPRAAAGPSTTPASPAFEWIDGDEFSSDEEGPRTGGRRGASRPQLPARQSTRIALRRSAEEEPEEGTLPDRERQQRERERRLRRREQARERVNGHSRHSRRSTRAQRAQRRDQRARFLIDSDEEFDSAHGETSDDDVSLVDEEEEYGSDDGAGPSRRSRRNRAAQPSRRGTRKRSRVQRDGQPEPAPREVGSFMWLMSHNKLGGLYVPQVGDDVIYIKRGHIAALEETNDPAPPCLDDLREAEHCTVQSVSYFIARDGTDGTAASLLLRAHPREDSDNPDDASCHEFEVNVYSPQAGLPDFLVLRSLFDHSASRPWKEDDPCKAMFWNEDREDWYEGAIVGDALGDYRAVDDPYQEVDQLWERFSVKWDLENESSSHSPWELRPLDADENEFDQSELEEATVARVKQAIFEAATKLEWDIFQVAPLRDDAYESHRVAVEYYNQLVALPIGLMDIQSRLDNHYYRRSAALQHDISLIADNAVAFNGEDHDVSKAAKKLCRFLTAVLDGTASARDIETFAAPSDDEEGDEEGHGDRREVGARAGARRERRGVQATPVATRRSRRERRPVVPLSIGSTGVALPRNRNPPRRSTRRNRAPMPTRFLPVDDEDEDERDHEPRADDQQSESESYHTEGEPSELSELSEDEATPRATRRRGGPPAAGNVGTPSTRIRLRRS